MKEFKYIFKVDHTDPKKTLQFLGEKVAGEANAFDNIDIEFVQNQDFITAVPVEVALTTELRANLLYHNPDCRFVVTGVPVQRIKNLVEYGYTVFANKIEEDEKEEEEKGDTPDEGEETQELKCDDPEPKEEVEEKKPVRKYFVDGKPVSKEEFEKATEKLMDNFKGMGFLFKDLGHLFG